MRTSPLLLLLALSACTATDEANNPGAKYGEFGVGEFRYRCVVDGDPSCPNGESTAPQFPAALALGSQLDLQFAWIDPDPDNSSYSGGEDARTDPLPDLQSVMKTRLLEDGTRFIALTTGIVGVIAITSNSEVVEIVHFEIAEVDELRVVPSPSVEFAVPLTAVDITTNEERDLQGLVVDFQDRRLGGILPYSWSSEDPTILEIVDGGDSGRARVRGISVGTTNLVLTQGEHILSVPVTVSQGLGGTDATTTLDSTTGTDTSTTDSTDTGTTDTTGGSTGTTGGVL